MKLPGTQTTNLAWYGPDLASNIDKWVVNFSDSEISELEATTKNILDNGLNITEVRKHNFLLPVLGPKLKKVSSQLIDGIGFVLLGGVPT